MKEVFAPFEYFVVTPSRAKALNHFFIRVIRGQPSHPDLNFVLFFPSW
jgi:hypothetical protein